MWKISSILFWFCLVKEGLERVQLLYGLLLHWHRLAMRYVTNSTCALKCQHQLWEEVDYGGCILGMLIPEKWHSRVESHNSWVSIETWFRPSTYLLLAWLESDRRWGREGGRVVMASRSQTPFPADAGTLTLLADDQHSRWWRAQTSQNGQGECAQGSAMAISPWWRPGNRRPHAPLNAAVTPLPNDSVSE